MRVVRRGALHTDISCTHQPINDASPRPVSMLTCTQLNARRTNASLNVRLPWACSRSRLLPGSSLRTPVISHSSVCCKDLAIPGDVQSQASLIAIERVTTLELSTQVKQRMTASFPKFCDPARGVRVTTMCLLVCHASKPVLLDLLVVAQTLSDSRSVWPSNQQHVFRSK